MTTKMKKSVERHGVVLDIPFGRLRDALTEIAEQAIKCSGGNGWLLCAQPVYNHAKKEVTCMRIGTFTSVDAVHETNRLFERMEKIEVCPEMASDYTFDELRGYKSATPTVIKKKKKIKKPASPLALFN